VTDGYWAVDQKPKPGGRGIVVSLVSASTTTLAARSNPGRFCEYVALVLALVVNPLSRE
jgi:hypothetical protein